MKNKAKRKIKRSMPGTFNVFWNFQKIFFETEQNEIEGYSDVNFQYFVGTWVNTIESFEDLLVDFTQLFFLYNS